MAVSIYQIGKLRFSKQYQNAEGRVIERLAETKEPETDWGTFLPLVS